jgi:hypothetical protein
MSRHSTVKSHYTAQSKHVALYFVAWRQRNLPFSTLKALQAASVDSKMVVKFCGAVLP